MNAIGVYGLGRFGAFWAEQLAAHVPVKGYNRSAGRCVSDAIQLVSEDELLACDTIVLCVAISSLSDVLSSIASRLKVGTLVMDTCSVKVYPSQMMQKLLPETVDLIATHPMFGPDSGQHGIDGLPLVFSPVRCSTERTAQVRTLFESMRLRVIDMSCDQHDREAAYSQGITHFIGRVLNELHLNPTQIATVGYQQLMSLVEQTCNDPLQLFYDLQRYNPYTHDMRMNLNQALDTVLHVLETHDRFPVEFPQR